ncbi:tyrosine-protein phosphatase [Frankia sp. AgKG'84/4]|uniref:tyrosine-protein phosphatase n=1 Tax=Frankia sp. AgKG'84/4 TaxID=573490 RepID=UPI0020101710|nr:tyrosine-protein phosphatase [Frankia sp. AgKG'84/4]MCL9795676.1 tyrosine-protein phosphatase [Frankia sp. AgKG'84/4]
MDRWLNLTGCDNVRDLGGLPTTDGSLTRHGALLRADSVQTASADDVILLRDTFGLRTIIDLRAREEAAREGRGPLAAEAIEYHHLSFLPGEWVMPDDPRYPAIVKDLDTTDRIEHYLNYLRAAGDAVAQALRVLASPSAGPALFHCAAGKDRTGVLAALVLGIAGVEQDAIIDDYAQTNERIARVYARLADRPSYRQVVAPASAGDLACRPEVMRGFLDGVDAGWGGPAAWALQTGVSEPELRALRQRLVG